MNIIRNNLWIIFAILLSGCMPIPIPIWLPGSVPEIRTDNERESMYVTLRGKIWHIHVTQPELVRIECLKGAKEQLEQYKIRGGSHEEIASLQAHISLLGFAQGCVIVDTSGGVSHMWTVDNDVVAKHECEHIATLDQDRTNEAIEREKKNDSEREHRLLTKRYRLSPNTPADYWPCGQSAESNSLNKKEER